MRNGIMEEIDFSKRFYINKFKECETQEAFDELLAWEYGQAIMQEYPTLCWEYCVYNAAKEVAKERNWTVAEYYYTNDTDYPTD